MMMIVLTMMMLICSNDEEGGDDYEGHYKIQGKVKDLQVVEPEQVVGGQRVQSCKGVEPVLRMIIMVMVVVTMMLLLLMREGSL